MTATQDTPVNASATIDAGPLALSARIRRPRQQPRGVIVALHGGTYDSSYYDTGADSLLDLTATLGYLAVAVDRPGYGATHGADPELLQRPMPMPELTDVVNWSDRLPSVVAAIDVPVRATLAEHDNIWQSDTAAQTALRQRFTQCPSIRVESFPGAGHSIELHRAARAYLLRQLAFAEECLSASYRAGQGKPERKNRTGLSGAPTTAWRLSADYAPSRRSGRSYSGGLDAARRHLLTATFR
jgi:hypothetical protein